MPGINELFDFDYRILLKTFGNGLQQQTMDFPLSLSDPSERFPYSFKYVNYMADRLVHYGHAVPSTNLFLLSKDKIMSQLMQNRANPTAVG